MTEEAFFEYISKLWSMLIWGNKKYIVDKLIADNGFTKLKKQLVGLLYGNEAIETRWDIFLKSVKGLGPATISELLCYINPTEYVIFNKTTIAGFTYLDINDMPKYNYQYTGEKYKEVCDISKEISSMIKSSGEKDYDLLAVDYFMWDEILPLTEKNAPSRNEPKTTSDTKPDYKSIHDEIKEKLVSIGELLGFESQSEVKIATGAVVDAVADETQLSKIISESRGVIDEDSLRTWEAEDVMTVYDSQTRAHESINKLALVPESFK